MTTMTKVKTSLAAFAAFAWLTAWHLTGTLTKVALVLTVAGVAVFAWYFLTRSGQTVNRWGNRSRRKHGVASTLDILRFGGRSAMLRKSRVVRPSLGHLNTVSRHLTRVTEVAVPLCRVGPVRLFSSVEDVTLIFGGPRTGKSGWLGGRILDAPGACIVTSSRTDLYTGTHRLRADRGPVWVFNATGLGGVPSSITFNPLRGCTDPVAAGDRAADLIAAGIEGSETGDRAFWSEQARRVLAALMHAAALGDLDMRAVLNWVSAPEAGKDEILRLLHRSRDESAVEAAAQFLTTNSRTQTSITSTIMPALGWLASAPAWAAAADGAGFDVAALLRSKATVYLLGAQETHAAPLVTALTGYLAREARRLAALEPDGRLDPPLTLALDEAALISPVPLDSWTADMGGRGVTIIAAFQSRAQLLARWGVTGAAVILNNAAAVMLFGGTRDRDDLGYWSTLAGERDEDLITRDFDGKVTSRTVRKVQVLSPAQLANLPVGKVVVFRRGMAPAVGTVRMVLNRWDVRRDSKAARRLERGIVRDAERATEQAPPVVRATATRVGDGLGPSDADRAGAATGRVGDDG